MRQAVLKIIVLITTTFVIVSAFAAPAGAQTAAGRLRLESLERLAPKAVESVNIELDGLLIKFAGPLLSEKDEEERAAKEIIEGLRGIYVRSYEFKSDGQFNEADVLALREQLRAPGWSRVVDVKSKGLDFGDAEVYIATAGGRMEGLALLLVTARELTVINIVGSLDLDKIRRLGDNINLPRISIKKKKAEKN